MFSIGLEISLSKMGSMESQILRHSFTQATLTALVMMAVCYFGFSLDLATSLIISLAFVLSSTAIVLGYLK